MTMFPGLRKGQIYSNVQIGSQCWLQKNMNLSTGNSWCYDDNTSNCNTYGRLYDWQTALGACPSGWHLPSNAEWEALKYFLGGYHIAGGKMKSISGWYNNGNGTNSSGFTGLPGGQRDSEGYFNTLTWYGVFWSSTEKSSIWAWKHPLQYNSDAINSSFDNKTAGMSARCLKD